MINEAVSAVCKRLSEEFGEDYRIYTEQVVQGCEEPCFFVSITKEEITPIVGKRYNLKHSVNVVYSPAQGDNQREDIYDKLLILLDILEYVDIDGPTMGENLRGEVAFDDAGIYLSVNAEYQYTIYKNKNDENVLMGELKQEVDING